MSVVVSEDHEDGMHVSTVSKACVGASGESVMEAIEDLMGEGLLFSTIDDLVSAVAVCGAGAGAGG